MHLMSINFYGLDVETWMYLTYPVTFVWIYWTANLRWALANGSLAFVPVFTCQLNLALSYPTYRIDEKVLIA